MYQQLSAYHTLVYQFEYWENHNGREVVNFCHLRKKTTKLRTYLGVPKHRLVDAFLKPGVRLFPISSFTSPASLPWNKHSAVELFGTDVDFPNSLSGSQMLASHSVLAPESSSCIHNASATPELLPLPVPEDCLIPNVVELGSTDFGHLERGEK